MTVELNWLTLVVLLTAVFWLPYVLDRIVVRGLWRTISNQGAETGEEHSDWAKAAMRAHANAVENLVIFAPLVLVLHAMDLSTPMTRMAVVLYFFARLVHFPVYVLRVPVLRTLSFAAGWVAQMILALTALGWM